MNTTNTTQHNHPHIFHLIQRCAIIISLLFTYVIGVSAQKYYVMYYVNESGSTQYLEIKEDGSALLNTSYLSPRCYWVADAELIEAKGKNGENKSGSDNNNWNQDNRKNVHSFVFPTKYLTVSSSGTESTCKDGTPLDLRLYTSATAPTARWLLDNENKNTPVLYQYYYKHYIYYNNAWKYSSNRTDKSKLIQIESRELLPPPSIYVTQSGDSYQVRMSAADGCTIYYTTNGSMPTTNSTTYSNVFSANKGTTIKAFVVREDKSISSVAEVILPNSLTITLDDREDHGWTYYSGMDGNYNTTYEGKLYSPEPRNLKITYSANGGAVSINEPVISFVYYKTLEKKSGKYSYRTIANPFSKRPSQQTNGQPKTFQGFSGWKVKSISGGTITNGYISYGVGAIIPAEQETYFTFTSPYSTNCISAEVEFEAVWVPAKVTYLASLPTNGKYEYSEDGGTDETNFLVLKCNPTSITVKSPCTIMMVEPDGSDDYRSSYEFTGTVIPVSGSENNTRIEYTHWKPTTSIDAKGRNFTIGRGMIMDGATQDLFGSYTASITVDQILRVESGVFKKFSHYYNKVPSSINKQCVIFGCDYDRANNDNGRLTITDAMTVANSISLPTESDDEICRVYSLSGSFLTGKSVGQAEISNSYYLCSTTDPSAGHRYFEILGGEWMNIAGGWGNTHATDKPAFTFRMRGGIVKGAIYGAAEWGSANGTRTYVITGGTINGWVAGGANGTRLTGGIMDGVSNIYIGGNARIDSGGATTLINRAVGGNVFGAGCGYCDVGTSGEVTLGSNIVIADNAYVERGVYGGGSFGYCTTTQTSNIYITGGEIGGKVGGVRAERTGGTVNDHDEYRASYSSSIPGGVFGGACQNKGGNVNIYMTGGTINGGLYGGSNASGEVEGPINLKMTGGTVENIFGGGNEAPVTGNTNVTITGGKVKQNVYGGGNKAAVSGTTHVVIGS